MELQNYTLLVMGLLLVMVLPWLISIKMRNVSTVDSLWSLIFLCLVSGYAVMLDTISARGWVVLLLVTIWALRLSVHISFRVHGKGEDKRYKVIRENNEPGFKYKSLYIVFWLQTALAAVIAIPLIVSLNSANPISAIDFIGLALWISGMFFEVVGDYQLTIFQKNPNNKNKVLNTGLWQYTRHPNYFGECVLWWGFYFICVSAGGWWTIFAPIVMTILLVKVSGVTLLEDTIEARRPNYAAYIKTTNAFIPGTKKKVSPT